MLKRLFIVMITIIVIVIGGWYIWMHITVQQKTVTQISLSKADVKRFEVALNSTDKQVQCSLLPTADEPTYNLRQQCLNTSGPIHDLGTKVTILADTFRSTGDYASVSADVAGKGLYELYLVNIKGQWLIFDTKVEKE